MAVWNAGVHLLFTSIKSQLTERLSDSGVAIETDEYDQLSVDDFIDLCEGRSVSYSWAFRIRLRVSGMPDVERLAWTSFMGKGKGKGLYARLSLEPGRPVLEWSIPNPAGYPRWIAAGDASPGGEEMTIFKDRWLITRGGSISEESPSDLAAKIAEHIAESTIPGSTL